MKSFTNLIGCVAARGRSKSMRRSFAARRNFHKNDIKTEKSGEILEKYFYLFTV